MMITKDGTPIMVVNTRTIELDELKVLIMDLENEDKTKG